MLCNAKRNRAATVCFEFRFRRIGRSGSRNCSPAFSLPDVVDIRGVYQFRVELSNDIERRETSNDRIEC